MNLLLWFGLLVILLLVGGCVLLFNVECDCVVGIVV